MRNMTLMLLLLTAVPHHAYCYLVEQVGVHSNFLFVGDSVLFLQSDETLTVLAMDDGHVILRTPDRRFQGELSELPEGILVRSTYNFALLDKNTFRPLWQTDKAYDYRVAEGRLVSSDGNGLVSCRDLSTGQVLWRYDLPGASEFMVENGKVVISSASFYNSKDPQVVVLLDLASGRELWRKGPPTDEVFGTGYFDGTTLYFTAGRLRQPRRDTEFEYLVLWDLSGRPLKRIPATARWRSLFDTDFFMAGKHFMGGRVIDALPGEEERLLEERRSGAYGSHSKMFPLTSGTLTAVEPGGGGLKLVYRGSHGHWRACLSYLEHYFDLSQVAQHGDSILLGSDSGHVECLDARTGASRWVYVFPTIIHTVSFSSPGGLPPYVLDQARNFRRLNARQRELKPTVPLSLAQGTCRRPTVMPAARIVADPKPTNPFSDLPFMLGMSWFAVSFPAICIAVLIRQQRRGKATHRGSAPPSILLLLFSTLILLVMGRASYSSLVGLKLTLIALGGFIVWNAVALLRRRHWIEGVIYLGIVGALGWLLRFAILYHW